MYSLSMPTELIRKQVLLSDDENAELERKAKENKLSVSNYIRKALGFKPLERGFARIKEKKESDKN